MFEDDGKETSSDEMNTSHEDLTCTVWSEDEDNANNEPAAEVTRVFTRHRRPAAAAAAVSADPRPMSLVSVSPASACSPPASPASECRTTTSLLSTLDSADSRHIRTKQY